MKASELFVGKIVRYHPDGKKYQVRAFAICAYNEDVAWLTGKAGCVLVEALSDPEPPIQKGKDATVD